MRRRDFLSTFAAGAALLSPAARAQQQKRLPVIGYLGAGWPDARVWVADAFRQGLMENGYVEGRNVAIEYRWAEGKTERFPELAAELVGAASMSSSPLGARSPLRRLNAPRRECRSCSSPPATHLRKGWSPAWRGRAAT